MNLEIQTSTQSIAKVFEPGLKLEGGGAVT